MFLINAFRVTARHRPFTAGCKARYYGSLEHIIGNRTEGRKDCTWPELRAEHRRLGR